VFCKLLAAIACVGVIACGLLSARQQRLQAARDSIRLHDRLAELRQSQWSLDLRIADSMRPEALNEALAGLDESWSPIVSEPVLAMPTALAALRRQDAAVLVHQP
jgi:hypothetical protein